MLGTTSTPVENNAIFECARYGDAAGIMRHAETLSPDALKAQLEQQRRIEYPDWDHVLFTPISIASRGRHLACIVALLRLGADPNEPSGNFSPIELALQADSPACLAALLAAGARCMGICLHIAATWTADEATAAECTNLLLVAGADHSARAAFGETALGSAASSGRTETMRLLIAAGADVNSSTRGRADTPLLMAAREWRPEAAALLLRHGADPNATSGIDGCTALHLAAGRFFDPDDHPYDNPLEPHRAVACAELLLAYGARHAAAPLRSSDFEWVQGELTPLELLEAAVAHGRHEETSAALGAAFVVFARAPLPQRDVAWPGGETLFGAAAQLSRATAAAVRARRQQQQQSDEAAAAPQTATDPIAQLFRGFPPLEVGLEGFTEHVLRRAERAEALRRCAERAEREAAVRSVGALELWRAAAAAAPGGGSKARDKLAYAAARCVGKWAEVAGALRAARRESEAASAAAADDLLAWAEATAAEAERRLTAGAAAAAASPGAGH